MIEAPINVTPDNETVYIDKTQEGGEYVNALKESFTFNGDNLAWWRCEYYDNVTGEIIGYSYAPKSRIPWSGQYRNGDTVPIDEQVATGLYQNGNDYKYRFILYQADSNNEPLCDMLCVTGRVQADSSGTSVTVEKGVSDIDAPYIMDSYEIGYCMLDIVTDVSGTATHEKIKIAAYNKSTGVITLDSALSGTAAKGTRYKVFRSYYKTPCYFVRCRDKASITPGIAVNAASGGVECTATWAIASEKEVSLQKYKWELTSAGAESKEIYSYHDKGAKPDRNVSGATLDAVFPILANQAMNAVLTTTSQDGYVQTESVRLESYAQSDNAMFEPYEGVSEGGYYIEYSSGLAMLKAENRVGARITNESGYTAYKLWKRMVGQSYYRYVAEMSVSGEYVQGYDQMPDDGINTQYAVSAKKGNAIVWKTLGVIRPDYGQRAVIQKLGTPSELFGLRSFAVSDTFIFDFELSKPTFNISDGQAVIETGNEPIIIKESGRYLSGDFSAAITQMIVNGYSYELRDTQLTFENALEFFDESEFLLKLPERGCYIVKITGKSLRKNDAGATILSFDFTQVEDKGRVIVE
jgi:hypothetical protein